MSAWEPVPLADDVDWNVMTDEQKDEYLRDVFDELGGYYYELRMHDDDGYLAFEAGSSQCLALGHLPNPEDPDDWGGGEREGHPLSWDGDVLCEATRYETACMACEGACSMERVKSLWSMAGVTS